jgi:hypothetical protein
MRRSTFCIIFNVFRGTFTATADGPLAIIALVIIAIAFLVAFCR